MSSLTAPWDRKQVVQSELALHGRGIELVGEELQNAQSELVDNSLITKLQFRKIERARQDPQLTNQIFCLHSFIPSKGATPDEKGCYGMMKCRGTFPSQQQAEDRSKFIIKNHDSYHPIVTGWVGDPFPCVKDTRVFSEKTDEVDIRKTTQETISGDVKEKRHEEQREMKDIKEREERLLNESKEDYVEDPAEKYKMLRVKKAQLSWTYSETAKKMEEMKEIILKTREEIAEMEAEDPTYPDGLYEHYLAVRRETGITNDQINSDAILKGLVEDLDIGF